MGVYPFPMNDEILAANQAFYEAFAAEDEARMDALWARRAPVTCVHPGWPALIGRVRVMASFRAILMNGAPPVRAQNPSVQELGEVAYVICDERIGGGRLVATNVFVREDGEWRMAHHHAGQVADARRSTEPEEPEEPEPSPSDLN